MDASQYIENCYKIKSRYLHQRSTWKFLLAAQILYFSNDATVKLFLNSGATVNLFSKIGTTVNLFSKIGTTVNFFSKSGT